MMDEEQKNGMCPIPSKVPRLISNAHHEGSRCYIKNDDEANTPDEFIENNLKTLKPGGTYGAKDISNINKKTYSLETSVSSIVEQISRHDSDLILNKLPDGYKKTYQQFLEKISAMNVSILRSIEEDKITNFKYFHDRYFENYFCMSLSNFGKESIYNDILIRVHSNKLVLLALAKGHYIRTSNRKICNVNYFVNNSDRSVIKTKGKRKLGSKPIEPHTILCQIKLEGSDDVINVRAGITGCLIEINERIKENPTLLVEEPTGLGYLGVVFPKGKPVDFKKTINSWGLLTEEGYNEHLEKRTNSPDKDRRN